MKKLMIALSVVAVSFLGLGCEQEDLDAAADAIKDAGAKVGDAIEDTGKKLGDDMEAGKQRMRDAADEIEKR